MRTQRDLRWNFAAAVIDAAGWGVGMGLVSAATFLPLFVRQLTHEPLAIGLIQATMLFGWLVPGLLVSTWVERLPRVKVSIMWVAAVERAMLLLMAPLCLWLGPRRPDALLGAFFGCWFIMNAALGANTPGYFKLIAKTIPAPLRGRLYGIGGACAGLVGVAGGLLGEWFLKRWGFPGGYAACFLAAFVVQTVTVLPLAFMREAAQPPEAAPEQGAGHAAIRQAMTDPRLLWLCAALALFSLNQMAAAFYTDYAIRRFQATPETVARLTTVLMAAKTAAFLVTGWISDHRGNRAALQLATASGIVAAGAAWAAPEAGWMYAVFALNEVAVQGWGVCSINYMLELCPPERAGTYTAVFSALSGPGRVLFPLLAGVMVGSAGYGPVFGAAVAGGILALLLLLGRVVEPRHGSAAKTAAPAPAGGAPEARRQAVPGVRTVEALAEE